VKFTKPPLTKLQDKESNSPKSPKSSKQVFRESKENNSNNLNNNLPKRREKNRNSKNGHHKQNSFLRNKRYKEDPLIKNLPLPETDVKLIEELFQGKDDKEMIEVGFAKEIMKSIYKNLTSQIHYIRSDLLIKINNLDKNKANKRLKGPTLREITKNLENDIRFLSREQLLAIMENLPDSYDKEKNNLSIDPKKLSKDKLKWLLDYVNDCKRRNLNNPEIIPFSDKLKNGNGHSKECEYPKPLERSAYPDVEIENGFMSDRNIILNDPDLSESLSDSSEEGNKILIIFLLNSIR
jgi:hypothetical protein